MEAVNMIIRSLLLVLFFSIPASAQMTFTPFCEGINDTARFTALISTIGANEATINLPYKSNPAQRCTVNSLTIPSNITLSNANGSGIWINTGQELIIVGPPVGPPRQFFFNALAGQGTVSFSGNRALTEVYGEWWGAGVGKAAATNASALIAANAALVTMGAGKILLAGIGTYDWNAQVTLGSDAVQFTSISLEGVGGLVGTKLNWTGSTSGVGLYVTNARAVNIKNIFIANGVALGTSTGILLGGPGPGTGTQTSGVIFENSYIRGFATNVQIGTALGAASEIKFDSCGIDNTTVAGTGIKVVGGNSVVVLLFRTNITSMAIGLDIAGGGDIHIQGGSFGHGLLGIKHQTASPLKVSGVRFELDPSEVAIQVTNGAPIIVDTCEFQANAAVPASPVISGKGQWTLQNNTFGQGSNAGWLPIEVDTAGIRNSSLVMSGNRVYGDYLFYINPGQTTSDGLTYNLFGNEKWATNFFSSRFPDEQGRVTWPNKTSFVRLSSGFAGNSISPDQITANQNNYTPAGPGTGLQVGAPMYLRLSTDASRNITGLTFAAVQIDGQTITLINVGSFDFVLKHQDAASTAGNRFLNTTGADITVSANQLVTCVYDGVTLRWRCSKLN